MIELERSALDHPDSMRLILALNAELMELYPEPGANHFRLDVGEVAPGRGAFVMLRSDGEAQACGAIRVLEPGVVKDRVKSSLVARQM